MSAHYVYRCFDSEGRLIYVGATKALGNRLDGHAKASWWAPQTARVVARVYPTKDEALRVERLAIASELPRWNRQGKWTTRQRWTTDQWIDYLTAVERGAGNSAAVRRHLARARREFMASSANAEVAA